MIRFIIVLSCFIQFSFSDTIVINNDFEKTLYKSTKKVFSTPENLSIKSVQKKEFSNTKKSNFAKTPNYIWTKFNLVNNTNRNKELFFRNLRPGIDYIDVYIIKNKKVLDSFFLGDLIPYNEKRVLSRKSIFNFNFEKNSSYEIYIKYQSIGAVTNQWEIFTPHNFFRVETIESMIWGIIYGIFISLMIYNSILYFMTKNSAFLFYVLSTLFSGLYLLTLNGVIYQLDLGINLYLVTISTWYFAYLYIIFILLFIVKFFNERKNSRLYRLVRSLILFQIFSLSLLSIGFYDNTYHYTTSRIDTFALLSFLFIFLISIFEFKKEKNYSLYFLIGQAIYIVCFNYYTLEVIGIIESYQYSWIILPIGLLLEVIFISLALNAKMNMVENEKVEIEQQLLEQSRFTNAGRTISYIIHQIKRPISQLGSQINLIEATSMLDKKNLPSTVEETLPKIKTTLEYINEVNHSVDTLFLNPNGKESFSLSKQLNVLISLLSDYLLKHNIEVKKEFEDIEIKTYKGSLSNVIMVILENAIYELKNLDKQRFIKISTKTISGLIYIEIEDSGNGVDCVETIFSSSYSTKLHQGSGVGLSLAKIITEKKLEGKILAINTSLGAKFILKLPIK
ncbi:7TM diverse intracellular signaling domain-containing protein [Halarcobacter sp.]|uniref:7TM diverse intracellular signaling domain-containing protein n=1 Tax=Halarcobacter sp. TaxID=2321133 RepID=UPI003AFF7FCD